MKARNRKFNEMTEELPDANGAIRHYWNKVAGPRWVASQGVQGGIRSRALRIGTPLAIILPTAVRSYGVHEARAFVLPDIMRHWALNVPGRRRRRRSSADVGQAPPLTHHCRRPEPFANSAM
jgi:hypothetical protein